MRIDNLLGFGLAGFRSYGSDMQYAGPMERVHLIAGKNNSGKSNLIKFLIRVIGGAEMGRRLRPETGSPVPRDVPAGWGQDKDQRISLCFSQEYFFRMMRESPERIDVAVEALAGTVPYHRGKPGVIWINYILEWQPYEDVWEIRPDRSQILEGLRLLGTNEDSSMLEHDAVDEKIMQRLHQSDLWDGLPSVEWIEAKREIGAQDSFRAGDTELDGWRNGRGFIPLLAKLQNPETINYERDRPKFDALQTFVRSVLEDPSASISVPNSAVELQVTTRGRLEPHTFLGTGLAEIVHLAAVATAHSDTLIAIEEPEVHLHPSLQRQLVRYLQEHTSNRYMITTHSSSLLDFALASVSHVSLDANRNSTILPVLLRKEHAELVQELGNRASEIVQANFVVWVEGPSDRIYVAHWLNVLDPELVEGVHFSIMFYGGALLSHLTAQDDPEVEGFIELAFIARRFSILIDSDRREPMEVLNATKMRVIVEVEKRGGLAWVTDGYTIENYIDDDVLAAAIRRAYPTRVYPLPRNQWQSPLRAAFDNSESRPNKVTVARAMLEENSSISTWSMELRAHVSALARDIRSANGLTAQLAS